MQGKRCMVWSFMGNSRMYQALRDYGDRLDTVGIFTFEVDATGTISETGTSISSMMPYINKWPHIKWMLTVMNHGTASIFTALRNNTNGAKDKFLTELVRIMQKYPWCAGVDIDLERGGEYENRTAANALFHDIYNTVKNYNPAKLVNICLPGMTSVNGSVGGENWCVYADLDAYCENAKKCVDENPGYSVFDESGKAVYTKAAVFKPYLVRVTIPDLNIRKGPGTDFGKTGKYTGIGAFTIVEEADGKGASKWGLLKSYQSGRNGWVSLDYAQRV